VQRSAAPSSGAPGGFAQALASGEGAGAPEVELLSSTDDLTRIAAQWNELHERASAASIFNSWIWQYQWWQVYGRAQPLRVLVARDENRATGEKQTLGIVAFYVQTVKVLGVRVRLLRFVGTGADTHPDDLGPVLAAGAEEAAALALARTALRIADVDVVLATDIDPRSCFARALEQAATEVRLTRFTGESERIAFTGLPRSWSEFMQSLGSDRRSRIRSARKKTAEHGARFYLWQDGAAIGTALEQLADLHRRRWQESGGSESFASAEYLAFHRRIMQAAFARGWLRLYCLDLDGRLAAMTYCYRFRNRVYLMQAGFDPALSRLNPGKVLLGHALEHAIVEGNEVFDYLRGEHRYKDQLATGHRQTLSVRVFHRTAAALAYGLRRIWLPLWKARLLRRPAPKLLP
jgi:CelD/BcsL family acetyltransferase involved in cellulose biosynthesis